MAFPNGKYPCSWVKLERVGGFEFCSLFSPMGQFEEQAAAKIAAEAAVEALMTPAEPVEPVAEAAPHSRRTLLLGRRRPNAAGTPA